jgi:hypothetical protein
MTSVRDILVIAIVLFAVGISILFAVNIGHRVNSNLLIIPAFNNSVTATSAINHADAAINMVDYLYLACFIAFFISIIIFGWLSSSYPILAPIYFFIVIIFVFVSIILQLAWNDIALNPQALTATASIPITAFILSHLGLFMAVFGLVGILVMFGKPQNDTTTF